MSVTVVAVLVAIVGVVAMLAVLAAVLAASLGTRRPAPAPSEAAEAARRHGVTVNAVAWVLALLASPVAIGGVALPVVLRTGGTGLYGGIVAGLYPAALGLLFLAVHAVGERTWPRPTGTVRRAVLSPRQDVAPRWLLLATWSWAGALAITLTVTGLTGTDGRTLERITGPSASAGAGPYPGWFYGLPLLVAAALLVVATHGVLRLVARRPAVVDADPAYDAASRRLSGHRVLRGVQLVLALTLSGVLFFAGNAIRGVDLLALGAVITVAAAVVALAGAVLAGVPAQAAVPQAARPVGHAGGPTARAVAPAGPLAPVSAVDRAASLP